MVMQVEFMLNGKQRSVTCKPSDYLLDTLQALDVTSVRRGCETSSCGVCTVLVDGLPILSCSYLSARVHGKTVTTVEGISDEVSSIADHFGDEGADQCGFCNSGIALAAYALKQNKPDATDDDIKNALSGHLCRCSGYQAQIRAIRKYLGDMS
jgi:aerobic carbon-monoxide dehydrogenase small subunit